MALTYRQVKDIYDRLKDAGVTDLSLPQWAAQRNEEFGTNLYSEGLHDNLFKRGSVAIDKAIEWTGAPELGEKVGREVGSWIGAADEGADIGEGLPRSFVNFLPMMLVPELGLATQAARLGGTALLSGSDTYEKSGSPLAGLFAGVTNAAMPGIGEKANQWALKKLGGELIEGAVPVAGRGFQDVLASGRGVTEAYKQYFAKNLGQSLGANIAEEGATAAADVGSQTIQALISGDEQDISAKGLLLEATLGQLPYTTFHVANRALGITKSARDHAEKMRGIVDKTERMIEIHDQRAKEQDETPAEKGAHVPLTPEQQAKYDAGIARLKGVLHQVESDPNLAPEQRTEMLRQLERDEENLANEASREGNFDAIFGTVEPRYTGAREVVNGRIVRDTQRSREVLIEDPEHPLNGKIVRYAKWNEPAPQTANGQTLFSIPTEDRYRTVLHRNERDRPDEEAFTNFKEVEGTKVAESASMITVRYKDENGEFRTATYRKAGTPAVKVENVEGGMPRTIFSIPEDAKQVKEFGEVGLPTFPGAVLEAKRLDNLRAERDHLDILLQEPNLSDAEREQYVERQAQIEVEINTRSPKADYASELLTLKAEVEAGADTKIGLTKFIRTVNKLQAIREFTGLAPLTMEQAKEHLLAMYKKGELGAEATKKAAKALIGEAELEMELAKKQEKALREMDRLREMSEDAAKAYVDGFDPSDAEIAAKLSVDGFDAWSEKQKHPAVLDAIQSGEAARQWMEYQRNGATGEFGLKLDNKALAKAKKIGKALATVEGEGNTPMWVVTMQRLLDLPHAEALFTYWKSKYPNSKVTIEEEREYFKAVLRYNLKHSVDFDASSEELADALNEAWGQTAKIGSGKEAADVQEKGSQQRMATIDRGAQLLPEEAEEWLARPHVRAWIEGMPAVMEDAMNHAPVRDTVRAMDVVDVVKAIRSGDTSTPLVAINEVIEDAAEHRRRVEAESERRAQPRRRGKASILEQLVKAQATGRIDAKEAKTLVDFVNKLDALVLEDTAISLRSRPGTSSYDFLDNLATVFINQQTGQGLAHLASHELWHGLSRFLPVTEMSKMKNDYVKAVAEWLKKEPAAYALIGRYTLTKRQLEDYATLASKGEVAKWIKALDTTGREVPADSEDASVFRIRWNKDNYRYIMLDEWIAEKMADLVKSKAEIPTTQLGRLAKMAKDFFTLIKETLGLEPYERFYSSVIGDKATLQRATPVEPAQSLWEPWQSRSERWRENAVHAPRIDAGGGFFWDLVGFNPVTNKLGKHTLPKDGLLTEAQFKTMAGEPTVSDGLLELAKMHVPGAFDNGKVHVGKLFAGLGEVVKVEVYGQEGKVSEAKAELDRMTHEWVETLTREQQDALSIIGANRESPLAREGERAIFDTLPQDKVNRYLELKAKVSSEPPDTSPRATYMYAETITPWSYKELKANGGEFVRVDVLLNPREGQKPLWVGDRSMHAPAGAETLGWGGVWFLPVKFLRSKGAKDFVEGGKWVHLPDKEKVVFVGEQQSEWGQERARYRIRENDDGRLAVMYKPTGQPERLEKLVASRDEGQSYIDGKVPPHPLLDLQHVLVLKAVIAEAAKRGVRKVVLSDGETAMMTEGHDKHLNYEVVDKQGNRLGIYGQEVAARDLHRKAIAAGEAEVRLVPPSQSGGMRLHYDTTLLSAMKKLTGSEGELVELGVHKNAIDQPISGQGETTRGTGNVGDWVIEMRNPETGQRFTKRYESEEAANKSLSYYKDFEPIVRQLTAADLSIKGSPVFRNPDGTPKSSVTGRAYDISTALAKLETNGGFSLTGKSYAPRTTKDPSIKADTAHIGEGGPGLVTLLSKSNDPLHQKVVGLLQKYPELLSRVDTRIEKMNGTSYAMLMADGRVSIALSEDLFSASPATLRFEIAHELLHGVSLAELVNPTNTKIVAEIGKLREEVVKKLPPSQRAVMQKAIAEGWLQKLNRGQLNMSALDPDVRWQQVMYGLLNDKEFVSQGWASPEMREFLSGQKVGLWKRLVGAVKKLLGHEDVEGSLLDVFMNRSTALLNQGEFISTFKNFAEGHLVRQGMTLDTARPLAEKAMRVFLDNSQVPLKMGLVDQTLRESLDERALNGLRQFEQENPERAEAARSLMKEVGYGLDGASLMELAKRTDVDDVLDMLPREASEIVFKQLHSAKQLLEVVHAATHPTNKYLVNVAQPKDIHKEAKEALKHVERLLKTERAQQAGQAAFNSLTKLDPGVLIRSLLEDPSHAPAVEASLGKRAYEALEDFFNQPAQWAVSRPELQEFVLESYNLDANARKMLLAGTKPMNYDFRQGKATKEAMKETEKVLGTLSMKEALDSWKYLEQKDGNREGGRTVAIPMSDPRVEKLLYRFSPEQREMIANVKQRFSLSNKMEQTSILQSLQTVASYDGATLVLAEGKTMKEARELANELFLAAFEDTSGPQGLQMFQQRVDKVRAQLTPDTFIALMQVMAKSAETAKAFKDLFDQHPEYVSGRRRERFLVTYKVFEKGAWHEKVGQAMSEKEGKAIVKKEGGQLVSIEEHSKNTDAIKAYAEGVDFPEFIKRVEQSEREGLAIRMAAWKKLGLEDKLQELIDTDAKASTATQMAREVTATMGNIRGFDGPVRGLTKGADKLPWTWNQRSSMQQNAVYWSRQIFKAMSRATLMSPGVKGDEKLEGLVRRHVANVLSPDSEGVRKVQKFLTTWLMGLSIPTAVSNAPQTLLTTLPELVKVTGSHRKAYGIYGKTVNEVKDFYLKNKWNDKELDRVYHRMSEDGELDRSLFSAEAEEQEAMDHRITSVMMGTKVQSFKQKAGSLANRYAHFSMIPFRKVERMNSLITTISAYRAYRQQGLGEEEAYDQAKTVNHAVNYTGGRLNRPIGLFEKLPRPLAMLATTMQAYTLGTTGQLARYIKDGYFRPNELTPAEIYAARKAARQFLGMQTVLAGVLGLPFASGMLAVLEKFFPGLEPNKHIRETLHALFAEDEEDGFSYLADVALTGLPSAFGWDMQPRLSLGHVPGVSEMQGFEPGALLGPVFSVAKQGFEGASALAQGDMKGGYNFLPAFVRKLVQYGVNDGKMKDYSGKEWFEPTRGEALGAMLGFQPKRLADLNSANRMARLAEDVDAEREGRFRDKLAEETLAGNLGTVRERLKERLRENPKYDVKNALNKIIDSAEAQTFPRDLRREGTTRMADARRKILERFAVQPKEPDEMKRLEFRRMLKRQFGLADAGPADVQLARMVDELRLRNPSATRLELVRMARQALGGSQPTSSSFLE